MAVFYRVPNKAGYFDTTRNPSHNMDEPFESLEKEEALLNQPDQIKNKEDGSQVKANNSFGNMSNDQQILHQDCEQSIKGSVSVKIERETLTPNRLFDR